MSNKNLDGRPQLLGKQGEDVSENPNVGHDRLLQNCGSDIVGCTSFLEPKQKYLDRFVRRRFHLEISRLKMGRLDGLPRLKYSVNVVNNLAGVDRGSIWCWSKIEERIGDVTEA